jgi:hypothetical protein
LAKTLIWSGYSTSKNLKGWGESPTPKGRRQRPRKTLAKINPNYLDNHIFGNREQLYIINSYVKFGTGPAGRKLSTAPVEKNLRNLRFDVVVV